MINDDEPWVVFEEDGYECIVGNQSGLEKLWQALGQVLEQKESERKFDVERSNIQAIKLDAIENCRIGETQKESFKDRLIDYCLLTWFLVLPFVAIALILYLVFF